MRITTEATNVKEMNELEEVMAKGRESASIVEQAKEPKARSLKQLSDLLNSMGGYKAELKALPTKNEMYHSLSRNGFTRKEISMITGAPMSAVSCAMNYVPKTDGRTTGPKGTILRVTIDDLNKVMDESTDLVTRITTLLNMNKYTSNAIAEALGAKPAKVTTEKQKLALKANALL